MTVEKVKTNLANNINFLDSIDDSDALVVVPPSAALTSCAMGAHNIQTSGAISGFSVKVLYANLEYACLIGTETYNFIVKAAFDNNMFERLFSETTSGEHSLINQQIKMEQEEWIPDNYWHQSNRDLNLNRPQILNHSHFQTMVESLRKEYHKYDLLNIHKISCEWRRRLAALIAKRNFSVVGCTTTFGGLAFSLQLLKEIKILNPGITTIIGGAACQAEMAEGILSTNYPVDYIFEGEADHTFPEVLQSLSAGEKPADRIIPSKRVGDLNELTQPMFDDYISQVKLFNSVNAENSIEQYSLTYETSRGCWWNRCTFCGLNLEEKKYRIKKPEKILSELTELTNRYQHSYFTFSDNIIPKSFINNLVPQLARRISGATFGYEIKSNQSLANLLKYKEAGITWVQPGIESLSDPILKLMKKGATLADNLALLRRIRSIGHFHVVWNLLYGFPGDKEAHYREMFQLIRLIPHLSPPVMVAQIVITRFSLYYNHPEKFGIKNITPLPFMYNDIYPPDTDLNKLAYFFNGEFESDSVQNTDIMLELDELVNVWRNKWMIAIKTNSDILAPSLHISSKETGEYELLDARGIKAKPMKISLSEDEARKLLTQHRYEKSDFLQWALNEGLGIISEDWFIPLATADADLLLTFENASSAGVPMPACK